MINQEKAYCPGSISLIFKVHPDGSTGVGFTIDKGVTAVAKKSKQTKIKFNKKPISFPTISDVISALTNKPVSINLESSLPLGCGFGLSGASALSTAYAVSKLFKLRKTKQELVKIAHLAEVKNKTGLGSVVTQSIGGCLIKYESGLNPKFARLPFNGQKLYCKIIGKLETPGIIGNKKILEKINTAADYAMSRINKKMSFAELIDIANIFAKDSGLAEKAHLNLPPHATMTMLGRVVLTIPKPVTGQNILEVKITNG